MNIQHRTLNIEHRMTRSLRSDNLYIDRLPYSEFDVFQSKRLKKEQNSC